MYMYMYSTCMYTSTLYISNTTDTAKTVINHSIIDNGIKVRFNVNTCTSTYVHVHHVHVHMHTPTCMHVNPLTIKWIPFAFITFTVLCKEKGVIVHVHVHVHVYISLDGRLQLHVERTPEGCAGRPSAVVCVSQALISCSQTWSDPVVQQYTHAAVVMVMVTH